MNCQFVLQDLSHRFKKTKDATVVGQKVEINGGVLLGFAQI
jgi:hypothetical protein